MDASKALRNRDGAALASFFKSHQTDGIAPGTFNGTWFETAIASKWQPDSTYDDLRPALDALMEACKEEDGEWLFPVLGLYIQRLGRVAGYDRKKLQNAKELFDSIFRTSIAFARKARAESFPPTDLPLLLVNELMKIYVRIKSDSMARSLIGTVEHPTFPPLNSFSRAKRVVYSYYVGRNAILEGDPDAAIGPLEFAYKSMVKGRHDANRLRVLEYLVPAKLALGWQPNPSVFKEIQSTFPLLANITLLIAKGDVRGLNQVLESNSGYFCNRGTYTTLMRCKLVAFRNLMRLCVKEYRETCEASERNKIPLTCFLSAIKKWDDYSEDLDGDLMDHAKCRVINLVSSGLMKGYLAYDRAIVVVSANDTFPKTSTVLSRSSSSS